MTINHDDNLCFFAKAIFKEGCKSVAADANVMDLWKGINMVVDAVIADLKSRTLMISTPGEITQVATISANGTCYGKSWEGKSHYSCGEQGMVDEAHKALEQACKLLAR